MGRLREIWKRRMQALGLPYRGKPLPKQETGPFEPVEEPIEFISYEDDHVLDSTEEKPYGTSEEQEVQDD